jgi:transposase
VYGASASSLSRWVKRAVHHPEEQRNRCRANKVDAIKVFVATSLKKNPFQTIGDLVAGLSKEIPVSKSSVHRCIKRLNLSRKRTSLHFSPKVPTAEQSRDFLQAFQATSELISVDECSVCLEGSPIYGYSLKGTRVVKRMNKPPRGNRVTLLLAISNVRGVVGHQTMKGSCNTKLFTIFMESLDVQPGATIVMDNVRFHHSTTVKAVADHKGLHLLYTPPYSPEFNPVENAFSVIKSHTRRFDDSISDALLLLTRCKSTAFFEHTKHHIKGLLDKAAELTTS